VGGASSSRFAMDRKAWKGGRSPSNLIEQFHGEAVYEPEKTSREAISRLLRAAYTGLQIRAGTRLSSAERIVEESF